MITSDNATFLFRFCTFSSNFCALFSFFAYFCTIWRFNILQVLLTILFVHFRQKAYQSALKSNIRFCNFFRFLYVFFRFFVLFCACIHTPMFELPTHAIMLINLIYRVPESEKNMGAIFLCNLTGYHFKWK